MDMDVAAPPLDVTDPDAQMSVETPMEVGEPILSSAKHSQHPTLSEQEQRGRDLGRTHADLVKSFNARFRAQGKLNSKPRQAKNKPKTCKVIKSLSNNSQDIRKYFSSLHKNSGSVRAPRDQCNNTFRLSNKFH